MGKPNVTMTQKQRTELFELYKQHADAMLRAGHAFQQEGMCARFIEEDARPTRYFGASKNLETVWVCKVSTEADAPIRVKQ